MNFIPPFLNFPNFKHNNFHKQYFKPIIPNKVTDSNFSSSSNVHVSPVTSNDTTKNDTTNDNYFLDILGIRLHYDDILLLALIFFLYDEGVNDNELFISLILLLLS